MLLESVYNQNRALAYTPPQPTTKTPANPSKPPSPPHTSGGGWWKIALALLLVAAILAAVGYKGYQYYSTQKSSAATPPPATAAVKSAIPPPTPPPNSGAGGGAVLPSSSSASINSGSASAPAAVVAPLSPPASNNNGAASAPAAAPVVAPLSPAASDNNDGAGSATPPSAVAVTEITLLRKSGEQYVNAAEIVVLNGTERLDLRNPAVATLSVTPVYASYGAENLVDRQPLTVGQTDAATEARIQITLARPTAATRIVIVNRQDCCQDRLLGCTLRVTAQDGTSAEYPLRTIEYLYDVLLIPPPAAGGGSFTMRAAPPPAFQACGRDVATADRAMDWLNRPAYMFFDQCRSWAVGQGYAYFALQAGRADDRGLCFGSNDATAMVRYGSSNDCTATDSRGRNMGGESANAIHRTL